MARRGRTTRAVLWMFGTCPCIIDRFIIRQIIGDNKSWSCFTNPFGIRSSSHVFGAALEMSLRVSWTLRGSNWERRLPVKVLSYSNGSSQLLNSLLIYRFYRWNNVRDYPQGLCMTCCPVGVISFAFNDTVCDFEHFAAIDSMLTNRIFVERHLGIST